MKCKLLLVLLLFATANVQAEWFLRGSHNGWGATQMDTANTKNTMVLHNIVFSKAGHIKFDRFGDWYENYGQGGIYGSNIAVAAGTWTITFHTDTKSWKITPASTTTQYHLRSNYNQWMEGTLLNRVGTGNEYEYCHNHNSGGAGSFQFKIDPNGGWGKDAVPASNYMVTTSGWVKILFNTSTKKITTHTNLAADCALPAPEPEVIALYQSDFCGKPERSLVWIKSQAELDAFLNPNDSNSRSLFKAPDFFTHKILVLSGGTKPTPGYNILLINSELNKNTNIWNIWVEETTPPRDQPIIQVITTPCLMLQLPTTPDTDVQVFSNGEDFLTAPAPVIFF